MASRMPERSERFREQLVWAYELNQPNGEASPGAAEITTARAWSSRRTAAGHPRAREHAYSSLQLLPSTPREHAPRAELWSKVKKVSPDFLTSLNTSLLTSDSLRGLLALCYRPIRPLTTLDDRVRSILTASLSLTSATSTSVFTERARPIDSGTSEKRLREALWRALTGYLTKTSRQNGAFSHLSHAFSALTHLSKQHMDSYRRWLLRLRL
jgi:hypothetical protein